MALTFPGVGSQKPVRDLRPREESLFREVKVVQNRYSTTVTFLLRDATLNLKHRVAFSRDKNVLTVDLKLEGPPDSAASGGLAARPPGESLLTEMEQKIAGGASGSGQPPSSQPAKAASPAPQPPSQTGPSAPAAAASGPALLGAAAQAPVAAPSGSGGAAAPAAPPGLGMPESNFFSTLATMVVGLAIMLGGLYLVLLLYKRYFQARLARFAGTPAMRQIASFSIGPRQRIVILEINGEWIACGVTPSQITFLTRLSGQRPAAPEVPAADAAPEVPGADRGAPPAKADPVHQFAEVLKQKVRSLKRIN
jgi:flagellar protein FliO/FliZ